MIGITPELIEALHTIRTMELTTPAGRLVMIEAVRTLDDAGIFAAIDEATGYDVDSEPGRISRCTCPDTDYRQATGNHHANCPGDPAEWGDLAYAPNTKAWREAIETDRIRHWMAEQNRREASPAVASCDHCRGEYKPKADGTLRPHACWKYDQELQTTVFGPLDIHGRGRRQCDGSDDAGNRCGLDQGHESRCLH